MGIGDGLGRGDCSRGKGTGLDMKLSIVWLRWLGSWGCTRLLFGRFQRRIGIGRNGRKRKYLRCLEWLWVRQKKSYMRRKLDLCSWEGRTDYRKIFWTD